jgi:hypothetical protein
MPRAYRALLRGSPTAVVECFHAGVGSDRELLERQVALQAEGAEVLARLDLGSLFGDVGPGARGRQLRLWAHDVAGLDVCLLAGVDFAPADVLDLLKRVVELPGFVAFTLS